MRMVLGKQIAVILLIFSFVGCNSKSTPKENSAQVVAPQPDPNNPPPHPCSLSDNFVDREICYLSSSIDTFKIKLNAENLSDYERKLLTSLIEESELKLANFKSLDENERKAYSEIYRNAKNEKKAGQ